MSCGLPGDGWSWIVWCFLDAEILIYEKIWLVQPALDIPIPPEVNGVFLGGFGGSKYLLLGGGPGCLGRRPSN